LFIDICPHVHPIVRRLKLTDLLREFGRLQFSSTGLWPMLRSLLGLIYSRTDPINCERSIGLHEEGT